MQKEAFILKVFYNAMIDMNQEEMLVNREQHIKEAKKHLKKLLRGAKHRCTCMKLRYAGPCETCQMSSGDVLPLRNFFQNVQRLEKARLTPDEFKQYIDGVKSRLDS